MTAPEARIVRLLRRREVADMVMLQAEVGRRSRRSVFRDLKRLGYLTSFTHRGRFYTLPDIPRFDRQGLWFHQDVGFSRFGTLKETVAHLVPEAPEGRTHGELRALLRVRVHNTLLDLVRSQAIGREVVEGMGEFVYVSAERGKAKQQLARRRQRIGAAEEEALPPSETVLAILVETLKAGRVTVAPDVVARRLSARGMRVKTAEVERVFQHYDLIGGKKNRSLPPTPSGP